MTLPLQHQRRPQKTTSGACLRYEGGSGAKGRDCHCGRSQNSLCHLKKHWNEHTGRGAAIPEGKSGLALKSGTAVC